MLNLIRTELLHHYRLALGFALVHLVVLFYMYTLGAMFVRWPLSNQWLLAITITGAAFGFFQMRQHRRGNQWLYLIHRPLATHRIFLSLALAGCALLALVLLLPPLVLLVVADIEALVPVEARFYLFPCYGFLLACTACFCGGFAVLSPNRLGFLSLILCTFGGAALIRLELPVLPIIAPALLWAFYLNWISFKPDLARGYDTLPQVLFSELSVRYGILWTLALILNIAYLQLGPLETVAPGSDRHLQRLMPAERVVFALEKSGLPDAGFLVQQAKFAEATNVDTPSAFSFPRRFQLPLMDNKLMLEDPDSGVRWIFSHAEMLFRGFDPRSGEAAGWLGPAGFGNSTAIARFDSVPWVEANRFILDEQRILQLDWDSKQLHVRYRNDSAGRFSDSLTIADNLTLLLSEQALFIFSGNTFGAHRTELTPEAVLELPGADSAQTRSIDVLELIDGYLVSVLYAVPGKEPSSAFPDTRQARQSLYRIEPGQPARLLASMPVPFSEGDSYYYQSFILSPGMRIISDIFWGLAGREPAERILPLYKPGPPPSILLAALAGCLLSGALTAWVLRSSGSSRDRRGFWIIFNTLTGIAGLLAFLLGTRPLGSTKRRSAARSGVGPVEAGA